MNRIMRIIAPFIILIGGLVMGYLGVRNIIEVKTYSKITAVVTKIEIETSTDEDGLTSESQIPYVRYTVDGKEYEEILQFASSDYKVGDEITVRYNRKNPHYVTAASMTTAYIYLAFGAVCIISFFVVLIKGIAF